MSNARILRFLITREDPDIILGTESWLSSNITSNECFPTDIYKIERRERQSDPHGEVFTASKKNIKIKKKSPMKPTVKSNGAE